MTAHKASHSKDLEGGKIYKVMFISLKKGKYERLARV